MTTKDEISARLNKVRDIIESLEANNKTVTEPAIVEKMSKVGYGDYTRDQAHQDKLKVFSETSFVKELSIFTFSHEIKKLFTDLDAIREEATALMSIDAGEKYANWTKVNAMKVLSKAVEVRANVLEGKALKVSVEMLAKELERVNEENKALKLGAPPPISV